MIRTASREAVKESKLLVRLCKKFATVVAKNTTDPTIGTIFCRLLRIEV
jgi:hypothetical protein